MVNSFLYIRYEIEFGNKISVDLNIFAAYAILVSVQICSGQQGCMKSGCLQFAIMGNGFRQFPWHTVRANFVPNPSRFWATTTFYNFSTTFASNATGQDDTIRRE
jgi:hypothetical protein